MTKTSEIRQAPAQRRVGTLTLGATLIVAGGVMMVSLFWPEADLRWAVKASPLILISLGVETLLAARSGSRIKYDWAGMVLCFVLVAAAKMCIRDRTTSSASAGTEAKPSSAPGWLSA